jgi:putative Ca2+/H+ antiporter (TMEM165/GDT1 family)
MEWKIFFTVFGTVFLAELGDKTQLATLLFSANPNVNKLLVFVAAASALTATSALGVLGGTLLAKHINERHLSLLAGSAFILIGGWTLVKALRG